MLSSAPRRVTVAMARALPAAGSRGLKNRAMTQGGSSEELVALGRLARANTTPYRVVLKLGNTNVKAAIVDDRRDLTVSSLSLCLKATYSLACSPSHHILLGPSCRWQPHQRWSLVLRRPLRSFLSRIAPSSTLWTFLGF